MELFVSCCFEVVTSDFTHLPDRCFVAGRLKSSELLKVFDALFFTWYFEHFHQEKDVFLQDFSELTALCKLKRSVFVFARDRLATKINLHKKRMLRHGQALHQ